ncbi:MAG: hypothetical protein CVT62_07630 [Actinobacteria bacterium HGW-Actinobacteria-2]|nr:MAG: hypothetical protein CVT62_07630 [Actinobacteria bacterium HGW-Actinobacteria-2]
MSPRLFVAVYVSQLGAMANYYKRVFGEDSVQFEGDEVLSLRMDEEIELFIQVVAEGSVFAELIGKQSIGVGLSPERYALLVSSLPDEIPVALETWTGGPAVDEGFMLVDPEGNHLMLLPTQQAAMV